MDTPSRSRPTNADVTGGGESPVASASTKPPARRLSADASSLSLEGSVSSSGSAGQPDAIGGKQNTTTTEACLSGLSDTAAAAVSTHQETESEFFFAWILCQPVYPLSMCNK